MKHLVLVDEFGVQEMSFDEQKNESGGIPPIFIGWAVWIVGGFIYPFIKLLIYKKPHAIRTA